MLISQTPLPSLSVFLIGKSTTNHLMSWRATTGVLVGTKLCFSHNPKYVFLFNTILLIVILKSTMCTNPQFIIFSDQSVPTTFFFLNNTCKFLPPTSPTISTGCCLSVYSYTLHVFLMCHLENICLLILQSYFIYIIYHHIYHYSLFFVTVILPIPTLLYIYGTHNLPSNILPWGPSHNGAKISLKKSI